MLFSEQDNSAQCNVIGGTIWYQIANKNASELPLIVVHGGPGTPHNYLRCLATLLPNRPVIFYDQLDCGLSAKTNDTQWWYLARFVDEIEKLSQHLGLQQFHLYGHSAGTMYAFDYALAYPHKVRQLVLSSPILSIKLYLEAMHQLLSTFPATIRAAFVAAIEQNETDTIELMEATAFFAEKHLCRLSIWPDELFESSIKTNVALRNYMWGASDFMPAGILKSYERLQQLPDFKVKTLLTVGQYDFVTPETGQLYAKLMNHAELAIIDNASHNPHLEQATSYAVILQSWLR